MSTATYEFKIDAPRERVWTVLTNTQEYENWNPFIIRASGIMAAGMEVELVCIVDSDKDFRGIARITSYEDQRRVSWEMSSGFKTWLVRIEVHERDEQSTDLTVNTTLKGLPLIARGPSMEEIEGGFTRMADALNKYVGHMAPAV